ncbi:MAG: methionyl-tRNA formyltransferase [Sideroxydans sp.]
MRILFAGTPHFAAQALAALVGQHEIVAVLTQPDRPAGRGMKLTASPVKQLAQAHGLPVLQPPSLKSEQVQQELRALAAEVMVVAAYGLILPPAVLTIPPRGCLNIHASLLPRWRGAAPIQRAILAGDEETGVTIMQMDAGLDTGDMLLKKTCPILPTDTAQSLHDKLAILGAQAIVEALEKRDTLQAQKQDEQQATYAAKLTKEEAAIVWARDAEQIARAIRAYFPFPTAYSTLHGTSLKIQHATLLDLDTRTVPPGTVIGVDKQQIRVACGRGVVGLEVLQKPGGKPLAVAQFIQGFPIAAGDRFGGA